MRLAPPGSRGPPPVSSSPAKPVTADPVQAGALNAGKALSRKAGSPGLLRGAGKGPAPASPGASADPAPARPPAQEAAGPLPNPGGLPRGSDPPLPPRETLAGLALTLGLAGDDLSVALLGFARYFSLPLEGGLLRKLRREALSSGAAAAPRRRAAAALAAAAAADKGLGLSAAALESYAAALSPGVPLDGEGDAGEDGRERGGGASPKAAVIREKALKEAAASPLLGLLNRAPGKRGGRWVVLPFTVSSAGVTLGVSLRMWLPDRGASGFEAERLALDIAAEDRRWLFIVDKAPTGKPAKAMRTVVYVDPLPEGSSPEALEREIREALGGEVVLRGGEIPAFADARDETLPRIDEEV